MKEDMIIDESIEKMVEDAVREKESLRDEFMEIEAAIRAEAHAKESAVSKKPDIRAGRNVPKVRRIWAAASLMAAAACLACGIFFRVSDVRNCISAGCDISLSELVMASRGDSQADEIVLALDSGDFKSAKSLISAFRSSPVPDFDLSGESGQYQHELYVAECQLVDYLEAVLLMRQGSPSKARKALKAIVSGGGYYASAAEDALSRL